MNDRGRLLISCPDRPGIVAAVSRFLYEQGANIIASDQHSTDPVQGIFFMRVEFELPGIAEKQEALNTLFAALARDYQMQWRMSLASCVKRLAIFVSRQAHPLLELFWRKRAGDLAAEIALIISNHPDLEGIATSEGVPFHVIPVDPNDKEKAERQQIALLQGKVDLVVFARYMQIATPFFIQHYPDKIINIHHSFLPAFIGADPYAQAYHRGVKLVGATAHYVTAALDAGPIIDQDIERVSHRDGIHELKRIGMQIERRVLARAVIWHVDDRVIVHGHKTIVFS